MRPMRTSGEGADAVGAPGGMETHLPWEFAGGAFAVVDTRDRGSRMDFMLRVASQLQLAPAWLVSHAFDQRPTLREHACSDDDDPNPTTLPHLLEHLTIDVLVQRDREHGGSQCFAGYSAWLDKQRGIARVTLSSFDAAGTQAAFVDVCRMVERWLDERSHG